VIGREFGSTITVNGAERRSHARYRSALAVDGGGRQLRRRDEAARYRDRFQDWRLACPECAKADCPVHDTVKQTWRYLNLLRHLGFLNARVPRIDCPKCGVRLVGVPGHGPVPASPFCSRPS
jgi:hypothetical protein